MLEFVPRESERVRNRGKILECKVDRGKTEGLRPFISERIAVMHGWIRKVEGLGDKTANRHGKN